MPDHQRRDWTALIALAFIVLGVWLLLGQVAGPWFDAVQRAMRFVMRLAWPLGLIALGVLLLQRSRSSQPIEVQARGKRLTRSRDDRRLSGVLGGLGEYLDVDSTWLRLAYAAFAVATGFFTALVIYFIASIVIPEESGYAPHVPPAPPAPPVS